MDVLNLRVSCLPTPLPVGDLCQFVAVTVSEYSCLPEQAVSKSEASGHKFALQEAWGIPMCGMGADRHLTCSTDIELTLYSLYIASWYQVAGSRASAERQAAV
jgi:hypothetical protein